MTTTTTTTNEKITNQLNKEKTHTENRKFYWFELIFGV